MFALQAAMSELGPTPLGGGDGELTVAQARAVIAGAMRPTTGTEASPLRDALGRILAEDILAPIDVPAHDNSAMDGYAFHGAELRSDEATVLRRVGLALAGTPFTGEAARGTTVRIMTGAVMPAGLDTVVPQELCTVQGDTVRFASGDVRPGDNRRRRGEDLQAGAPALRSGRRLTPSDLGLIASLGIGSVVVRRRLRVALFSTGNELRSLGEQLGAGDVYDSNRYTLLGALERIGIDAVDLGVVRDDPVALQRVVAEALVQADVVLTTGGVSAGLADHTRQLLDALCEVAFWRVAMRPGRPFAFGALHRSTPEADRAWLFALPGNPVAALVTFYVFVRDALLALAGAEPGPVPMLKARCATAIRKQPGRTEYQRARAFPAADGHWLVEPAGTQGSGVLRSMSEANALIVMGHDQGSVPMGTLVDVWLFDGLI